MELPDMIIVLIVLVMAGVVFVVAAMNRRREHALRDRFAEEYERIVSDHRNRDGNFR